LSILQYVAIHKRKLNFFSREKVLHYLAIRPIRLQDLITRLARGVTHVDKSKVQSLLNQVTKARLNDPGFHS